MRKLKSLILLPLLLAACATPSAAPDQPVTLAQLLSALQPGTTATQASALLRRANPNLEIQSTTRTAAHLTQDRCLWDSQTTLLLDFEPVTPQATPQPELRLTRTQVFRFTDLQPLVPPELFPALLQVHRAPSIDGNRFNPVDLLRAVNALHPLGKDKALKVLRAYEHLAAADSERRWRHNLDEQRIFLIARLLFVRNDGSPPMRPLLLGAPVSPASPDDPNWPLFPLVLQNDIPFCLVNGYILAGVPEHPRTYLNFCEIATRLRPAPLAPSASPLTAVESLIASAPWRALPPAPAASAEHLLRLQALNCIPTFRPAAPSLAPGRSSAPNKTDPDWSARLKDPLLQSLRWHPPTQSFRPPAHEPSAPTK